MNDFDIIDKLDGEEGLVRLLLSSGEIVYGTPLGIEYFEDEEGWETIKRISFEPYYSPHLRDFGLDDIASYEAIEEKDIPPLN